MADLARWFGLVAVGAVAWIIGLALFFRIPLSTRPQVPDHVATLYVVGLYLLLMGAAVWIWLRAVRKPPALGFSAAHLLEGFVTGAVGMAIVSGILVGLGWLRLAPAAPPAAALPGAALAAAGFAISEEALFRGFMLGLLRRDLRPIAAIWAGGVVFALLHFLRPFDLATSLVPFLTLCVAGALLGSARLRTGSIWFGVGLHGAWVFHFSLAGKLYAGPYDPGWIGLAGLCATYPWVRWRFPCAPS
ncbi:MAG: CPBP family intramembrane metalloprotease [Candidatus Sericytochromatia bacterium]|nr:CPBP family intramembrane metalloprotease [Candidatus Tanganyikabacteria bacterium]